MKTVRVALVVVSLVISWSCSNSNKNSDGRRVVVFWHSFVATTIPALEDLIARFEKEHPDIDVQAQYIPTGDGIVQKLVASIQSETAPDVAWIHSDFLDKLVEADAIYPMSHFVEGPNGLSEADLADIFPASLEACQWKGTLYALPMEATSLALFYNRTLLRDAGLDPNKPPATWSELEAYVRKLTFDRDGDGKMDQFGFFVPVFPASGPLNIWMNLQWAPFLWQAGGEEMTAARNKVLFSSDAGVKALTLWRDLYRDQRFASFGLTHDLGFAAGKIAMILDGPWDLPRFREMKGVDWFVAPLPAGPKGSATYIAGEQLAIFKQSRDSAAAWTFVKWILDPKVQAHFSMTSGYLPVRRSTLVLPEYRSFLQSDSVMNVFVEQMSVGRARMVPDWHRVEVNRLLAEALEVAIVGGEEPRKALARAAEKANILLKDVPETSAGVKN